MRRLGEMPHLLLVEKKLPLLLESLLLSALLLELLELLRQLGLPAGRQHLSLLKELLSMHLLLQLLQMVKLQSVLQKGLALSAASASAHEGFAAPTASHGARRASRQIRRPTGRRGPHARRLLRPPPLVGVEQLVLKELVALLLQMLQLVLVQLLLKQQLRRGCNCRRRSAPAFVLTRAVPRQRPRPAAGKTRAANASLGGPTRGCASLKSLALLRVRRASLWVDRRLARRSIHACAADTTHSEGMRRMVGHGCLRRRKRRSRLLLRSP